MSIDTDFVKNLLGINLNKMFNAFDLPEDPARYMEELEQDTGFLDAINERVLRNDAFRTRKFHSIYQFGVYRNLLYAMIRAIKPECVIETGVLHGLTSAWMLRAMDRNNCGEMISIDLPRRDWEKFFPGQPFAEGGENELELPDEEAPGWIVPEALRARWELIIGPSNPTLENVLRHKKPDFFVHDSDHSYELMQYECSMALRANPDVFLAVDNIDLNNYFNDLLHQHSFDYVFMDDCDHQKAVRARTGLCRLKDAQPLVPTNRRWQNHLRSKGIEGFIYDRLAMHAMNPPQAKDVFRFPVRRAEDDELSRWWFEWMEEFPYNIYVEPTNICNLHCRMCINRKLTRKRGVMTQALFESIVDQIAANRPMSYIHLYGIGEPLMDRDILQKLEYAIRTKGLKNLWLGTNGQKLLDNDTYKACIDLGVPIIGMDISGMTAETYESIHQGGSFEKIRRTVETVYDHVRKTGATTRIELAYILNPDVNDGEAAAFTRWCDENGYEYKLVGLHSWAGSRNELTAARADARVSPCRAQWDGMMVNWDGTVSTCFQDADATEIFGDLNEQSIREVWQGPLRQRRRSMVAGEFPGLCASCSSFIAPGLPGFGSSLYPDILKTPCDNEKE
jgi:MoaA/NifB/PqqE/SkfB family radical SAM enzyme